MILLIDNYDSFTYNLYQYLGRFDDVKVYRNDEIEIEEISNLNPDKIVISPGPKTPNEAVICMEVIKKFYDKIPILGICLGHQCIGKVFGSKVTYAKEIYHGKSSVIKHNGKGIFKDLKNPIKVARYHSLAIDEKTLSNDFEIVSKADDGEVMAIQHKYHKVYGLQFHPESICTEQGMKMIENFVQCN